MADKSAHELLVMALKNTHAMTAESHKVIEAQLQRFNSYPDVSAELQKRAQTLSAQRSRLETVLNGLSEKTSGFKELVTSLVGTAAMVGHGATGDEVLKDLFVDIAFAGMATACYDSLFAIAHAAGEPEVSRALQPSRDEEKQAYDWLTSHVEAVTTRYVSLTATPGATSSH